MNRENYLAEQINEGKTFSLLVGDLSLSTKMRQGLIRLIFIIFTSYLSVNLSGLSLANTNQHARVNHFIPSLSPTTPLLSNLSSAQLLQLQQLGLLPSLANPSGLSSLQNYSAQNLTISPELRQLLLANSLGLSQGLSRSDNQSSLSSPVESVQTIFDYSQQQQGWYYYNWQSPMKKQEAEERQLQQQLAQQVLPSTELDKSESTNNHAPPAQIPNRITTAWLKENLPKYLEQAMDNPSQENVLAYLYLQAYSVQKANAFSEQAKLVSQGNDLLDSNANFPLLSGARQYREQLAKHIREQLFTRQQGKLVLLLLVGKDFESRSFAQLVGLASLKFNWKLTLANIYGEYLPDLANYQQITDREQVMQFAQKYKAQLFPTLWVVSASDTQQLVSGAVDMEELEARLLRYLYRKQLITTAEYNLGKGVLFDPKASEAEIVELVNQQLQKSPKSQKSAE